MRADLVYLVQTNTTVGFLSQNLDKLNRIKQRPPHKKFVKVVNHISLFARVPNKHKRRVRLTPDTNTYIINNQAYRLITHPIHKEFLDKFKWMYSSSANKSAHKFDKQFAIDNADVWVYDKRGYFEDTPSQIFKLSNSSIKRIR
ncbi:MAG: Sua5 YciO YrdC YwlC family protein [Epsilonproteobacteria bacterium]|nr:Sua5 YciO YrdC YwlC family protein [Campylobacterota bacterium]